jgi:predicted MPP superfamily phosphohydrolase
VKALRAGFIFALLMELAILGIDALVLPLQARGEGNWLVSVVVGCGDVAKMPGVVVAWREGKYKHHIDAKNERLVHSGEFLFYFGLGYLVAGRFGRARKLREGRKQRDEEQKINPARRQFMRLAGAGAAGAFAWSVGGEPYRLEITRVTHRIKGLPKALDGLRVVQLTDIHHGPWFALEQVRDLVDRANGVGADLIVLTGDYVHMSPAYIEPVAKELGRLRARLGVMATLGNHDWRENGPLTQRELARAGITLLDNTRRILTSDGRVANEAEEGLCIAGVGDFQEHVQDYRSAMGGLPGEMPRVLLSHNPDVAEAMLLHRSVTRVDLMLSGHTHGGQIWVPGFGTPGIPSMYGQKYASGLVQGPICPVYVSRGIGMTILPMRFGVRPEMPVFEFKTA